VATLTQTELERHLWQAADILRGTVDAGDYKQYIFGLLFYRRLCDVWDEEFDALLAETGDREEAADPDEHRFHIPPAHHWREVRKHSTQIGQHLNNAFGAIMDANIRLNGVFGDVDFANHERFPDARLEMLLAHFEKHRLRNSDVPPDMLGDAYMYLIAQFAEGSGKKGGEFYTPSQVVKLIVECLDPQPGMSIYDPTCGSGGMLLEATQHLKDKGQNPRTLALYGQEKNLGTWAIAQINLFLHGIDDAFIAKGDTLLDPKRYDPQAQEFVPGVGAFDQVMANPPFSEKVWGYDIWSNGDPFGRDVLGCPPKRKGDYAFLQHMLSSLKQSGKLGVVMPHGVLFRGGAEREMRAKLVDQGRIEAIIGLPPNLFYGASLPASVMIFRGKSERPADSIHFINAVELFVPGENRNYISDDQLGRIVSAYRQREVEPHFSRCVPVDEVRSNRYSLNISRYVHPKIEDPDTDLSAPLDRLTKIIVARTEAEADMSRLLGGLVESSGDLNDWDEAVLDEICSFIGRGATPSYIDENSAIKAVNQKCIRNGYIDLKHARPHDPTKRVKAAACLTEGDVCVNSTGTGTLGRVALWGRADGAYFVDTHITLLRPNREAIHPKFLAEFLSWELTRDRIFRDCVTGSTNQIELGKTALGELTIPLPHTDEQAAIVDVLNAIDRAIELSSDLVERGAGVGTLQRIKEVTRSALFTGKLRVPE